MDCGFTHEDNRHGEHFECQKCGYTVNADYNAVARLHLAARQNACVLATAKNIGLRPEADTQTPFLAHVGGRRRTSRRAYKWCDVDKIVDLVGQPEAKGFW